MSGWMVKRPEWPAKQVHGGCTGKIKMASVCSLQLLLNLCFLVISSEQDLGRTCDGKNNLSQSL